MSHWTEEQIREFEDEWRRARKERGPCSEANRFLVWAVKRILKFCPMRRALGHACGLLWWHVWMDKYWPKSPDDVSRFKWFRRRIAVRYALWCWNSPHVKRIDWQIKIAKTCAEFENRRRETTA